MDPAIHLPEESDATLVARVVGGERAVFERLVRRHNQRLFRATRGILKSDAEAEDALQQAWLDVYRHLADFRGEAPFVAWATRIAIHSALACVRKRPVIAEVIVDDAAPRDEEPDAKVERARVGVLLERCLQTIPQGHREVMVLRDILELDTAETAACLGLSEEAVRVRLHRARAAIAATITEQLADYARGIYGFDGARCDRVTAAVMCNVLDEVLLQRT
jgi:RNA polymerase sigma-70 factor, ECF subfamily